MTNDTRPPVAPVEGFYAMLRNGYVLGPVSRDDKKFFLGPYQWHPSGSDWDGETKFDIIATISPEAMALVADPRLFELIAKADKVATSCEGLCDKTENLVKLADAARDYADKHCRWFDISTAPWLQDKDGEYDYRSPDSGEGVGHVYKTDLYDEEEGVFLPDVHVGDVFYKRIDHVIVRPLYWRPPSPPPSTPPLPAVFVELGAALEKIKGAG